MSGDDASRRRRRIDKLTRADPVLIPEPHELWGVAIPTSTHTCVCLGFAVSKKLYENVFKSLDQLIFDQTYCTNCQNVNIVKLSNERLISLQGNNGELINGSLYICGPTVYSDSHLGHALTYIRSDLFRRFMKSVFNVNLITVMNITDIDDKILARAHEDEYVARNLNSPSSQTDHPFKYVSEKYYKSFVNDMKYIRVMPPDLTIKISDRINLIIDYIKQLERKGYAYLAPNGDVYFKVASLTNYVGRTDSRKEDLSSPDQSKQDIRDFVLWKAAKPGEPVWAYKSDVTGKTVPGRPGWHVQCSAISSAIFGDKLDFHYGGKDLIFPHHYNEQACCCAYHNLDTSDSLHVWSKNWLHSGHLVLRDEKMSKSLGNVLGIRSFINNSSVNALRLLCIESHYRADVNFDDDLLDKMKSLDHKISAFSNYLSEALRRAVQTDPSIHTDVDSQVYSGVNLGLAVQQVHGEILDGVCDDFDLNKGLNSLLNLSKQVYGTGQDQCRPTDLVSIWNLLTDWCSMCGLEYGPTSEFYNQDLVNLMQGFRQTIRLLVIDEMKKRKTQNAEQDSFLKTILENCDKVRQQMDEFGFVMRDKKT